MSRFAPVRPTLLAHIGGWPVARQAAGSSGGYRAVIDRMDPSLHNLNSERSRTASMPEIRPSCENCGAQSPPDSLEPMICSFECTFCRACVEQLLDDVGPNCGGGFSARAIRPARRWSGENYLIAVPASTQVTSKPVDHASHKVFAAPIRTIAPELR
ncbi:MAG: DUF1272 domain-containing protein [Steroidobacterales bacterium]